MKIELNGTRILRIKISRLLTRGAEFESVVSEALKQEEKRRRNKKEISKQRQPRKSKIETKYFV